MSEPVGIVVPVHRYRVLFADGEVQDFLAAKDDSSVREQMLNLHSPARDKKERGQQGILGVADLGVAYEHHPGVERLDV
jgi:hypothetical protein